MNLSPEIFFDLSGYEHRSLFENCQHAWEALNNIEDYFRKYSQKPVDPQQFPGVTFIHVDQIYVGEGTVIEPGSYIEGPCILGKNCQVRHAAYLRKHVIAGDFCVIGHSVELKHVILLNRAHIAHLSYVGDSICGQDCNLGAGAKCANVKLDRKEIIIKDGNQRYSTGMRKLGAIIGDRAQLGCNSVTNPGTLIGKDCNLYPCTNFGGIAPESSVIRLSEKAQIYPSTKQKS